jgi:GNAT superfamily N-acetyltransferase
MGNSNRALITHAVDSLNSAAACFLLNRGFFIEHEEVKLRYEDLDDMIPDLLPPGFETMTLPMPGTATTFRHLYDLSFGDTPWHQPYLSDEEVLQELEDADDLHYLTHNHRPVGFAWLRWPSLKEAEVEPLGIIPDYQQRGLGRLFLEQVMDQAERQGAESVQISAWKQNEAALALYRRIGFHLYATTTYLGYQIKGKSQISQ